MNNLEIENQTIYKYGKYHVKILFSKDDFKFGNSIINNNKINKGAFSTVKNLWDYLGVVLNLQGFK